MTGQIDDEDDAYVVTPEKQKRIEEILAGRTLTPEYNGLSEEEAVEIIMLQTGDSEREARFHLKLCRGEITGDIIGYDGGEVITSAEIAEAMDVVIIDYGIGNLRSVEKAFEAMGCRAMVTNDEDSLRVAKRLVLPGVGAFAACMEGLKRCGFDELVRERVAAGVPLLGVCVGMQMLFEESEEFGRTRGLGFLRGRVQRFDESLLVPQVGWNTVKQTRAHPLFKKIRDEEYFYFVHSYYCAPDDKNVVIGETLYGTNYASVVAHRNVCGVQFHPEKSQAVGLQLLKNFAKLKKL